MSSTEFSEFELLLIHSENQLGTSVLLILAWIAASDGSIDESEAKRLREISNSAEYRHSIKPLIGYAQKRDTTALQLAAEVVALHFQGEKARLFLEMAIGMAIADGYLLATENHILRFLADLLKLSGRELNDIFLEVTGRAIPDPSDPSTAEYWRSRDSRRRKSHSQSNSSRSNKSETPQTDKGAEAYAVLGLSRGASQQEIKQAYRRLAQVHHPDRFSSLGAESMAAAGETFRRIKEAYDYLMAYA